MHASELEKWQRREIFRANTALLSLEFILYPFSRSLALSLSIYLSVYLCLTLQDYYCLVYHAQESGKLYRFLVTSSGPIVCRFEERESSHS